MRQPKAMPRSREAQAGPSPRISREKRTVLAMVRLYCRAHHCTADLCRECRELAEYAVNRLDRCPFGALKAACARCVIHCYRPAVRTRIREVMRYAGPRMLYRHPWLAIMHQLDSCFGGR
jgi:hypothetical protein